MASETPSDLSDKSGFTAAEVAQLAEAAAKAATEKAAAAKAAAIKAAEKEYEEAKAAVTAVTKAAASFTDKRAQERIFRREMGEPEFFRYKKDLKPPRPVLTEEEQEEISRKVEIPTDLTPAYAPEHVLSQEFGGTSDYESGLNDLLNENKQKLDELRKNPYATIDEITRIEEQLKHLVSLHENFYLGMNVFRTAKGGREKLKE